MDELEIEIGQVYGEILEQQNRLDHIDYCLRFGLQWWRTRPDDFRPGMWAARNLEEMRRHDG